MRTETPSRCQYHRLRRLSLPQVLVDSIIVDLIISPFWKWTHSFPQACEEHAIGKAQPIAETPLDPLQTNLYLPHHTDRFPAQETVMCSILGTLLLLVRPSDGPK